MSFSAFTVGRQMMTLTSNKIPQLRFGSKPVAGGSFTPTTLEAAFVMRSSLDYSFEKAFNDKYRAMMQNRLNDLQKKLQEAYTDILNLSMSQQVGQEASTNLRADVRLDGLDGTGNAQKIAGVAGENGFEDIGISPKTASRNAGKPILNQAGDSDRDERSYDYLAPGTVVGTDVWRAPGVEYDRLDPNYPNPGKYADDGFSGYGRRLGNDEVQFRTLLDQTTAAGNVAGDLHVTMRIEDDPPPPTDVDGSLDMLNSVTSAILGGPADPTYFNQKVDQHSTAYKTGGFWSAVNYLYNFAPREIKYTYAVGYTVNTDEAGDDEYLLNGELVDDRDIPGAGQAYLQSGSRVKWSSFDPLEGYQTERSGTAANFGTVHNREKAWIDGINSTNAGDNPVWDVNFTDSEGNVRVVENLIFQSGTYTYNGTFVNDDIDGIGAGIAGTFTDAAGRVIQNQANSASGLVNLTDSNIELGSVFRHKVDMTIDSEDDDVTLPSSGQDFQVNDRGAIRSSLFFNHYEIETRTVEFNNAERKDVVELWSPAVDPAGTPDDLSDDAVGKMYVYGGIERSKSIDTSKNYDLVDPDPGNANTTEREITRSSGNVNNSFNGEFVQGLHKIQSVNGQDIVGNETKQASPIIGNFEIGKYDGFLRSEQMTRNVLDYAPPSEMEVNAANSVPTEWYQAEMLATNGQDPALPANGKIWFPFVEDTLYSRVPDGTSDPKTGYGRPSAPRQLVQARNSFNLSKEEYMQLEPAANWVTDPTGVKRPTYAKRDYWVDVDLSGIHYSPDAPSPLLPQIYVNGRQIRLDALAPTILSVPPGPLAALPTFTPVPPGPLPAPVPAAGIKVNMTARINLKDYLQEGNNVITMQASDSVHNNLLGAGNYDEGMRIVASIGNDAMANATLNSKIITGYDNSAAVKYNPELTRDNTLKVQSRWQTRIVPTTAELDFDNKLLRLASETASTGSSYKVANSFIEMVINMLNQQKYRDIFKLGMLSNLNKLAIQGQANLPNGASMQGAITMYYDPKVQSIVLFQDRLTANS